MLRFVKEKFLHRAKHFAYKVIEGRKKISSLKKNPLFYEKKKLVKTDIDTDQQTFQTFMEPLAVFFCH